MEVLYENEYTQIRLNRDHRCLEYTWKRFAPSEPFKRVLEQVASYIDEYGCQKILTDMQNMKVIPQEIHQWVETDWFPRVIQKGVTNFALIIPSSALAKMSVSRLDDQIEEAKNQAGIITIYFEDIEKARTWLATV